MESDSDNMDFYSIPTTQHHGSDAGFESSLTEKVGRCSLAYNHGNSKGIVSRDDVAKVVDLIYYLIWDYTIIRTNFVPYEVRNAGNEKYLTERGFMESTTLTDLAAHGRLLYNDIKMFESGVVSSNFERQNLQMLKFTSICDNFKQMCGDLAKIRTHFEGRDYQYATPTRYFIIGDKLGLTSDESIAESFQALDIDLNAAESLFYTDVIPCKPEEWMAFWTKTPHTPLPADIDVVEGVKPSSLAICQKIVSFAEIDFAIPAPENIAPPASLSVSSETGLTAVASLATTLEESESRSATSLSFALDTRSFGSVEHDLHAATEPITTPGKVNSVSTLLLTPPPSAKKCKLKVISRTPPLASNIAQQVTTKGHKPRSSKTNIVKLKLGKKRAKTLVRITAREKVPWPLLAQFEKGDRTRQSNMGRRGARFASKNTKDMVGNEDFMEGVTRV